MATKKQIVPIVSYVLLGLFRFKVCWQTRGPRRL